MTTRRRSPIAVLAVLTLVLSTVPLLWSGSASAAPPVAATLTGVVTDASSAPLSGVTVSAVPSANPTGPDVAHTTSDGDGAYALPVPAGSYVLKFVKTEYSTDYLDGDEGPAIVAVASDGSITVDGDPVAPEDGLDSVSLLSSSTGHVTGSVSPVVAGLRVSLFIIDDGDPAPDPDDAIVTGLTDAQGKFDISAPLATYHLRVVSDSGAYLPAWYGVTTDDKPYGDPLVVTDSGISAGSITLHAPAGNATYPVTGTVVDVNSDPLDNVTVSLLHAGSTSTTDPSLVPAATSTGGAWTLPAVAPGSYFLRFSGAGLQTSFLSNDSGPFAITVSPDGRVSGPDGEYAGGKVETVILTSTSTYNLSGTVTNGAGIKVTAYDDEGPVATATTTGGTGAFTLALPVGTFTVQYFTDDGHLLPVWYTTGGATATIKVASTGTFSVGGTTITSLDPVTLTAPPSNATYDVAGRVLDVNDDPADGIKAELLKPDGTTVAASDTTGPDSATGADSLGASGVYRINVAPGTYTLRFSATGYATRFYTNGTDAVSTAITVGPDGRLSVPGQTLPGTSLADTTITGTATYNVTGTVHGNGSPLEGIRVLAVDDGDTSTADPLAQTTTNASGTFTLPLVTGSYAIRFLTNDGSWLPSWLGGDTAKTVKVGTTGALAVGGIPQPGLSVGDTVLTKPAANTTYDLAGEVDFNEDPINGVTVTVTPLVGTTRGTPVVATTGFDTTLGTNGSYRVKVPAGDYEIKFSQTGYGTIYYPDSSVSTTVTVGADGVIHAGADSFTGALDDVDLISTVTTTTSVGGKVLGGSTTPAPLSGIAVTATPSVDGIAAVTATSDGTGHYTLALRPGAYTLAFTDPQAHYLPGTLGGASSSLVKVFNDGSIKIDSTVTTTGVPDVTLAPVPVNAKYDLAGTVTFNGLPVDGVTATVLQGTTTVATAVTGADSASGAANLGSSGVYRFSLPAGSYTVKFAGGTGYAPASYGDNPASPTTIVIGADGIITAGIDSVDGGVLDPVELQLDSTFQTKFPISGKVKDADGPVSGISVKAFAGDDRTTPVGSATSGSDGTWTLSLRPGTYSLQFTSTGATAYIAQWYGGDNATALKLSTTGGLTADSTPIVGHTLSDVLLVKPAADATYSIATEVDFDDDPVDNIRVQAIASDGTTVKATDTTGPDAPGPNYLGDHGIARVTLSPGTYTLAIHDLNSPARFKDLSYGSGAAIIIATNGIITVGGVPISGNVLDSVDLTLADTYATKGTITGKAVDGQGHGIAGVTVTAYPGGDASGDPTTFLTATTTSTGTYSISARPGTYGLRFTNAAWLPTWYGSDADPGSVKVLLDGQVTYDQPQGAGTLPDVVMAKPATGQKYDLAGEVDDAAGDPLDGVTVEVFAGSTKVASATTGPDPLTAASLGAAGIYRISVSPGTYTVRYSKAGYGTRSFNPDDELTTPVNVTIAGNGALSWTDSDGALASDPTVTTLEPITLISSTKYPLSGKVTDESGTPVKDVLVRVFPDGDLSPTSQVINPAPKTAADGTFTVQLPVGDYDVQFDSADFDLALFNGLANAADSPTAAVVTIHTGGQVTINDVQLEGSALPPFALHPIDVTKTWDLAGEVDSYYDGDDDSFNAGLNGVTVAAVKAGTNTVVSTTTTGADTDTTDTGLGPKGIYRLHLLPGSYNLRYTKSGYPVQYYMPNDTWYDDDTYVPTKRAVITIAKNGKLTVSGEDTWGGVSTLLKAKTKTAKVSGKVAAGQTLTVKYDDNLDGSWDFGWYINGVAQTKLIDSEQVIIPLAAYKKKFTWTVVYDESGYIPTFTTGGGVTKIGSSKVAFKGKSATAKAKKAVTLKVLITPKIKPGGTLKILQGKKKVLASVKLTPAAWKKAKSGYLSVKLKKKLKRGTYKLTASYSGVTGLKGSKSKTFTLKVK